MTSDFTCVVILVTVLRTILSPAINAIANTPVVLYSKGIQVPELFVNTPCIFNIPTYVIPCGIFLSVPLGNAPQSTIFLYLIYVLVPSKKVPIGCSTPTWISPPHCQHNLIHYMPY